MLGFEAILAFESPSTQRADSTAFPPRPVSAYQSWETARFVQTLNVDFFAGGPERSCTSIICGKADCPCY